MGTTEGCEDKVYRMHVQQKRLNMCKAKGKVTGEQQNSNLRDKIFINIPIVEVLNIASPYS